jgi:hypothetical protein
MVSLGNSSSLLLSFLLLVLVLTSQNVRAESSPTLTCIGSTESTLTFSWTESNDPSFSKYTLYRSTFDLQVGENPNGPYNEVWSTTDKAETTATIKALNTNAIKSTKDAIKNFYYISESDIFGNSSKSNTIIASPTFPPNPSISIASKTATTTTLKWNDLNIYCEQAYFNSYVIQVSNTSKDGPWSTIFSLNEKPEFTNQQTYMLAGLDTGTYYVRMYDTVGTFSGSQTSYSNILTINSPNNTETPQPSPSVPELSWFVILPLLLSIFSAVLLFRLRRVKKLG